MSWLDALSIRAAGLGSARARHPDPHSTYAPSGALNAPVTYGINQPIYPTFDAETAIKRGYERTTYAYRCIEKISTSIAGLPFVAGNERSKNERASAPLARLLGPPPGGPNPNFSAAMLWAYSIAQYLTMGKFAWRIERNRVTGRVEGLWPLQAHMLLPIMCDPASAEPHYFKGYWYGVQGTANHQKFGLDDVAYFWNPSLADVRLPESPVRLGGADINLLSLLTAFDAAFLENGAVPSHLIVTDSFGEPSERRRFRSQFRRNHGGPLNAGKPMFAERTVLPGEVGSGPVPDPINVTKLGQSQRDSEMSALRDAKIQDVCSLFGVPLSMLGDSTRAKYTNMAADRANFWETCAMHMRRLEDMVNLRLASELSSSDVGWFDTAGVPELRPAPLITLDDVKLGTVTVDEYRREVLSMEPLPEVPDEAIPEPRPADVPPTTPVQDPSKQAGPDTPPSNVTPIKAARSVQGELRGVLAEQVQVVQADMVCELRARLDGKRGGRKKAEAHAHLADAFDDEHWTRKLTAVCGPTVRALGGNVTEWAQTAVDQVRRQLSAGESMTDAVRAVPTDVPSAGVSAESVTEALTHLASGRWTAADALRSLGETS